MDLTFEEIALGFEDDSPLECECDHGDEEAYAPCGRRAKWRVSIDCMCGENHPRTVELLCTKCLRTARKDLGNEAVTARPL
ncbi:hypothetical protein HD600_002758 [Microbacterium ginsengiterrae]|uniref:Uncharacterized protein n=1 Tax=Microbacterium ginsengiterrae TaxID=546115 RepID=A0A7W9CEV2_9MICO|nr:MULTISPECIES: hypothetical protein [Microbacterium]MBB5744261.1 hypothetical protein [Microbacterium ginsengiterrae]